MYFQQAGQRKNTAELPGSSDSLLPPDPRQIFPDWDQLSSEECFKRLAKLLPTRGTDNTAQLCRDTTYQLMRCFYNAQWQGDGVESGEHLKTPGLDAYIENLGALLRSEGEREKSPAEETED